MSAGEEAAGESGATEKTEDCGSRVEVVVDDGSRKDGASGELETAGGPLLQPDLGGNHAVPVIKQEPVEADAAEVVVSRAKPAEAPAPVKMEVDDLQPDSPSPGLLLARPLSLLGPPLTEKERRARERIELDQYDVDAWTMLANEAQSRSVADATPIFEAVLANFPTSALYWKKYLELQMSANNDDAVKQIFSRCLLNCLHVDLWKGYIRFMRKVNETRGAEGREEMKKAYEFTLNHVGMDIAAGSVWQEYILFLKATPVSTVHEESQRMTLVRKAYQRAVLAPVHLVEQQWKDYESFENSVSRALAKGLIAEYQPKHFSARAVYRERKKYCERIDQNILPVPPTGSLKEEQQCLAWRQLLAFEKGNPQRLEFPALTKRVAFTYEQCLMCLYHFPDVWYDFATWYAQSGSPDLAVAVFHRALKALPDSAVLHYAFAEFEEARGSIKEAKKAYESLLRNNKTANALAYIQFMRFVRRTDGVDEARKVFLQARKTPACTYHVFVASANLELCVNKDPKVARNIFELGLKKYIHEPAYVLEYADFLERMNDDRNVRVLFERALNVLPADESYEVWNRFLEFEQKYGDLHSMLKVEQRRKEALSSLGDDVSAVSEGALQQLISRYRFRDLWPCSMADLDHLIRQQLTGHKTIQKPSTPASGVQTEKGLNISGSTGESQGATTAPNVARPEVSQMVVYDPRQGYATGGGSLAAQSSQAGMGPVPALSSLPVLGPPSGFGPPILGMHPSSIGGSQGLQGSLPPSIVSAQGQVRQQAPSVGLPPRPSASQSLSSGRAAADSAFKSTDDSLKYLPPTLATFINRLPPVAGPFPDIDLVVSILLQSELLGGQEGQQVQGTQGAGSALLSTPSQAADQSKSHGGSNGMIRQGIGSAHGGTATSQSGGRVPRQMHQQKRKDFERQEEEEDVPAAPSRPAPRDLFRLRQMQRARASGSSGPAGSTSGGSGAFSGERSGSSE